MENSPANSSDAERKLRQRRWVAGIVAAAVVVASLFAFRPKEQPPLRIADDNGKHRPTGKKRVTVSPPRMPASPFLNTRGDVAYIGSQRCRDCHEDAHRTHASSLHSRSMSRVDPASQPANATVDHTLSSRGYRVEHSDGELWHREYHLAPDGALTELAAWPVRYQVGSGHVAKSYLLEDDGFLVQSPLTWFARGNRWDMSPGYDTADHSSFKRVIHTGCLYCHTGHVKRPDRPGFRHRIVETAIGCERCHGPGKLHVDAQTAGTVMDGIDRTIVNPRHLSRALSEAVCAQCHLQGDFNVTVRGRRPEDFRPGLPLHHFRLEFRRRDSDAKLNVAGHVEQLHQSRCYQQSNTLTCVTCHQPHDVVRPADRVAHSRAICASCHQKQPCRIPPQKRQTANGNNCVRCHMPQAETNVTHVALTHHRIGIHEKPKSRTTKTPSQNLVPMQPLDHLPAVDRDRSWGLAWLKLVRMTPGNPARHPRFRKSLELLRKCHDAGMRDPELLAALAGIARVTGNLDRAEAFALMALQANGLSRRERFESIDILAEVYFRRRDFQKSADYLRRATRMHRDPLHWYLLGTVESRLGRRKEAIAAFERAVKIAPGNADYHRVLVPLLRAAGRNKDAARHEKLSKLLKSESKSPSHSPGSRK